MAETINRYNEERKELDKRMTEEASMVVGQMPEVDAQSAIVIYNADWHKGVIGIVASRLTEEFFRPAVVLTLDGDIVTGSARSVSGFDVYKAIQSCEDLLDNFGGHTYAAGLSMKVENVAEFTRRFEEYVNENIDPEQTRPNLDIHAIINFKDITPRFHSELKRMRPFGPDNPKPMFCTQHVFDYGTSKVVGRQQEHIKLELVDSKSNNVMNGIAFGQSSEARYIKTKRAFDIVYSVEENSRKYGEVQLLIEDIRTHEQENLND
jgi:single-stranded-DNA-specific exonuclease